MGSAVSHIYTVGGESDLDIHQAFQPSRQTVEGHEPEIELLYHFQRSEDLGYDLVERVAPGGSLSGIKLVADREGTPHLLYRKRGPLDQGYTHYYASKTQSGWKRVEVRFPSSVTETLSRPTIGRLDLDVDEDGVPHVLCQINDTGATGSFLYYGKVVDSELVLQRLDEQVSGEVAIAAGSTVLFVAYFKNEFVLRTLPR